MDDLKEDGGNEKLANTDPATPPAAESLFARALRARNESALMPTSRVVKAPSRIKPAMKITGWFRCHPLVLIGPFDIFYPKDEGSFSDDPVFILSELADQLRQESTAFENAIREVVGYLVATKGGVLYLILVPQPNPATGRHHPAVEQKKDALEAARTQWKRLEWNKAAQQFDDFTAVGEIKDPNWPEDVSNAAILLRAFGERNVLKSSDDPLLLKFRGKA